MAKAREDGRPTAERHEGHDVTTTKAGRLYCRTCHRGELDVDEVAVERAVAGQPVERLTTAEREAAVAQLLQAGLGRIEIARRVRCDEAHVGRIKNRLGAARDGANA
jgi:DNA-binding NarL/FixJ family response regulator